MPSFLRRYWFAALLIAATLGIYWPGLDNALMFDDSLLQYGPIFKDYGSLLTFKQRMLSYGSFVWLQELVGQGWWKQRLLNVALHLAVLGALFAFLRRLFSETVFPQDMAAQPHFSDSVHAALWVGVGVFALHPMSVYAVGYLIQRSILMATLFSLIACWAFVCGLQAQRRAPWWYGGALLAYVLAVLSKEYAIMTAAFTLPLYLYLRRPAPKTVALIAAGSLAIVAVMAAVFYSVYHQVLGKPFDEISQAYTAQLNAAVPGFADRVYPLSIFNEMALFVAYGLRWMVPYTGWMSVDMRPAFPLGFGSLWHILGALAYLALGAAALWALLRRRNALALAGLLLLMPLLWYFTEFSTVWIQDPFVLYRSYLWATVLPGLIALALVGLRPRTIYILGTLAACALVPLALDRVASLKTDITVWEDATAKIDRQAPLGAVGRSRPYINLGNAQIKREQYPQAIETLKIGLSFQDSGPLSSATAINLGAAYQKTGQNALALQVLSTPEALRFKGVSLPYYRALALQALGRFDEAQESFAKTIEGLAQSPQNQHMEPTLRRLRADSAFKAERYAIAAQEYAKLAQAKPEDKALAQLLAQAQAKAQTQPQPQAPTQGQAGAQKP